MAPTPATTAATSTATPKKAPARKTPARTTTARRAAGAKNARVLPEDHTPSEAAAFELIGRLPDLTPSVNRIMSAELTEDGRLHALELFSASLGVQGDPNRTPANAVAAAQAVHGTKKD